MIYESKRGRKMKQLKKVLALVMVIVVSLTFSGIITDRVQAKSNPYINYKSVYVIKGKTFQVKLMNVPKGAKVKWSSSNKKVATVKAGKIKGVGQGICKITAKYKKKKYTCKVKVQRNLIATRKTFKGVTLGMINVKVDVQGVTYTDDAKPIYAEKNGKFQMKVYNTKKTAKWKSSNEAVATVSSKGLITAKSKGKCKITAVVAGKKVSCDVTITDLKNEREIANQEIRYEILRRLNIDRIKAKAKPLKMLDKLVEIADIRAKEASKKWSHTRPNGKSFSSAYEEVGFKAGKAVGENIAYTADKPVKVDEFVKYAYKHFYDEKLHRKTMLDSKYKCVGIGYFDAGIVYGDFGELMIKSYWSQEFYTK